MSLVRGNIPGVKALAAAATICLSGASALAFDGFREMPEVETANLLADPSFDLQTGERAWTLGSEAAVDVSFGNSQRGLGVVRKDKSRYSLTWQRIGLKPMTKYVFGGKVRTKGAGKDDILACIAIEWFDGSPVHRKGVYISGQYNWVRGGQLDWTDAEFEITTGAPEEDRHYFFVVYLQRGMTGEVSFDDLFIRETGGEFFAGLLNPYNRIDGKDRRLHFAVNLTGTLHYPGAEKARHEASLFIRDAAGKTVLEEKKAIEKGRFSVSGGGLADGKYTAEITVADTAARIVLSRLDPVEFSVGPPAVPKPPRGAVTIDRYGRTLVDGKPFMPIGLYTGGCTTHWELEYFRKSRFNTLLCYHSYFYRLASSKKRGSAGLRELMDILDADGRKLLISSSTFFPKYDRYLPQIKGEWGSQWSNSTHEAFLEMAAGAVKDHPALLGYYITDELPPERYKELVARRALFNRVDPYHPTTGVYFKLGEIAAYTGTQDAPSIDFYPISGKDRPQNQRLVAESMDAANRTWSHPETGAMPFWATLQLFSWGGNNPDKNKNYRMPTEHEHRAMALMSAIGGAKGFIYYYFHDICYATFTDRADWMPRFLENWRTISRALETLEELKPFILGVRKAPKVTVRNIKGEVRARAFTDDEYGRIRVLISSVGPGESVAEITVEGEKDLHTQFGRTKRIGGGVYRFRGTDVDCDVLQRWTERELEKNGLSGKTRLTRPDAGHARSTRRHSGVPAVAASAANGRLWVTWYASPTPSEDSNSYVILATSGDGGSTWKEVLVADPDGKGPRRAFDPQLFVGPDGKLRWFWAERKVPVRTTDADGWQGGVGEGTELWTAVLDADVEPRSAPEAVRIGYGGMACKPIVLKDGTWLYPCATYARRDGAYFLASKDGTSFVETGSIKLGHFDRGGLLCEQQAVELKDGRLWCWLRVDGGFGVGESFSEDGGKTWTAAARSRFVHTPTRTWLTRLKSGNLLLVKHGRRIDENVKRTQLTAIVSRDDGKTWEGGLELDAREGAAYPDGVQLADGTILVVYDRDRLGKGEILTARFTEEDVLAGKNVSGKVRLKEVIR